MTDNEVFAQEELRLLESEMAGLRRERDGTITIAKAAIERANREFDRQALPLGRRINELRAQIEAEQQSEPDKPKAPTNGKTLTPDPDWCQEDIAHFRELVARGQ